MSQLQGVSATPADESATPKLSPPPMSSNASTSQPCAEKSAPPNNISNSLESPLSDDTPPDTTAAAAAAAAAAAETITTANITPPDPTAIGTSLNPPSLPSETPDRMTTDEPPESSSMPSVPPKSPISSSQLLLSITLLLISGARHHFTIDLNYLTRHSLTVSENDPLNLLVYTLKECIWKDWREAEWDQRPPSAHFIRLIHFGRLLDDRQQLRDCRLNFNAPNVIHMTVRPADAGDDDMTNRSAKLAYGRDGGQAEGRSPTCRCVIL